MTAQSWLANTSAKPEASPLTGAELLRVVQAGASKRASAGAIAALARGFAAGEQTAPASLIAHTATWNAPGQEMAGWALDVTDTASAATAWLRRKRVSGVTVERLDKAGNLTLAGVLRAGAGAVGAPGVQVGAADTGWYSPAAGALALTLTGVERVRATVDGLSLTPLWNAPGTTLAALVVDVTDTASAADSALARLRVGGVTRFNVRKTGRTDWTTSSGSLMFDENNQLIAGGVTPSFRIGYGVAMLGFSADYNGGEGGAVVRANGSFGWSASGNPGSAPDLRLYRDGATQLALRNGAAAQTLRVYGTHTDGGNFRRLALAVSLAGVCTIAPEGAGSGLSGNVLHISGLPTSNPGPGILWNNAGAVVVGT